MINKRDIFTLNLPDNLSFLDILFDSTYRKIIDSFPFNYKLYKEYILDFDFIEEKLVDLLLRNKKFLNENIIDFVYNKEKIIENENMDNSIIESKPEMDEEKNINQNEIMENNSEIIDELNYNDLNDKQYEKKFLEKDEEENNNQEKDEPLGPTSNEEVEDNY